MLRKSIVAVLLLLLPALAAFSQPNARLRFSKELPKDLFTARTAVIITAVTTDAAADAQKKYDEITQKLKADNQKLGFNLVHYSNGEALNTKAGMQDLANTLNRLSIEKLFLLDYVNITGTGSQEKYKLVITPYNKTSSLLSENQTAYSMQAPTYERLTGLLVETITEYPSGYFHKAGKPNAANTEITLNRPGKVYQAPDNPGRFPEIYLSSEDLNRGPGGPQRNFFYTVGGQEKSAGFFGQNLRRDIAASPEAINYLNRYRADKWAYLAGWTVVAGSIVGYASQVYQDAGTSYFNDRQKVFAATAVLAMLSNTLVTRNTNLHLKKAVDEYSVFRLSGGRTGFLPLKPDNVKLGALPLPGSSRIVPGLQLTWKIAAR